MPGAVQRIAAKGTSLIVTVDNGISALDEISYAVRLGMDVVVTDHHQPRETLPSCSAVVNRTKGTASWISRFGGCWSCV